MSFSEREFRNALGHFATGVAVITADVDGTRLGATVSSFNSVSLSPPLVLFSLSASGLGLAQWQAARHYAVSILGDGQNELSNRFARSGGDKWSSIPDQRAGNGAPLLPEALAVFECDAFARHPGGDHEIFVGLVTHFKTAAHPADPLLFYHGKYRSLMAEPIVTPPEADTLLHGWSGLEQP